MPASRRVRKAQRQSESEKLEIGTDRGGVASRTKHPTWSRHAETRKMVNYA